MPASSTRQKQQLETKLKQFKDTTNPSVELAVAVVKTTGDRDISIIRWPSHAAGRSAQRRHDNPSALLFVAIDDRKYFTQVSKDLEDELPDGVVGSLQRQYLVPEFKKGNYTKASPTRSTPISRRSTTEKAAFPANRLRRRHGQEQRWVRFVVRHVLLSV